jgi:uncharacterized membrane protein
MRNYVAVTFDSSAKAYDGQHALWELDGEESVTVHGSAVVHRDSMGQLVVDTDDTTPPGLATALGAGVGALLGAIAGPVGSAIGIAGASAVTAGAGAAVGAGLGGSGGLIADVVRDDSQSQAGFETGFVLLPGQHAVIADVSEDWTTPIDTKMQRLGGNVFRRSRDAVNSDADTYPYSWDGNLYPYEYRPSLDTVG